ncbi:hypothetical protein HV824_07415 [Myxococcus sp. AM009]|uniref:hypothetical protein n=1 Tax=unclassified Myxococcus TaxID=2648731 RepID=UPI001595197B|nr:MULTISPECIES: hypothetical protein [unclassified Myxococcus]NVI97948.1 hypothetical protein [Myxococcus sp. AM009]
MKMARASYKDARVRAAFAMAPGMAGTYEARDVADIGESSLCRGSRVRSGSLAGTGRGGSLPGSRLEADGPRRTALPG